MFKHHGINIIIESINYDKNQLNSYSQSITFCEWCNIKAFKL